MPRSWFKKLRPTPNIGRFYLFWGVFFLALPSIFSLYPGHAGKLLVASGAIHDGVFEKTVIYLRDHTAFGAYGLVINRPVERTDIPQGLVDPQWNVDTYYGGPVGVGYHDQLWVRDTAQPETFRILKTVELPEENQALYEMLSQGRNTEPYSLYVGYAGWGPFQLDRELMRGHWAVIDFDIGLLNMAPEKIWSAAMQRVTEQQAVRDNLL